MEPEFPTILDQPIGGTEFTYLHLKVPVPLRDAVLRHHDNLMKLVAALRKAGISDANIKHQTDHLVQSYRAALEQALVSIKETQVA